MEHEVKLSAENFDTLAICAIRYCQGRQSYMPSLIQDIVMAHLTELSDRDLHVMIEDCRMQEEMNLYGSETIDKPGWIKFRKALIDEQERRGKA